jgi:hypothetical protein
MVEVPPDLLLAAAAALVPPHLPLVRVEASPAAHPSPKQAGVYEFSVINKGPTTSHSSTLGRHIHCDCAGRRFVVAQSSPILNNRCPRTDTTTLLLLQNAHNTILLEGTMGSLRRRLACFSRPAAFCFFERRRRDWELQRHGWSSYRDDKAQKDNGYLDWRRSETCRFDQNMI